MANVNVKVGYTVDKTGLNEIKRQLTDIRLEAAQAKLSGNLTKDLEEASRAASQLEDILNSAWNNKLSQLDLSKVNTGIKNTYGTVQNLQKALVKSGSAGATAYNNFAMQVLNTNIQLKQTSQTLDKMAITLKNTVRFGISSSIFNNLTNSVQKAYDYSVKLDTSLNDIRIVTEKSAEEMDKFAVRANKVAKDLGRSTKDFTEASLIYYQQGLNDREAQARAEVTMKAANVTGQTGQEVSEQLTSVWNGYRVSAEETELYVDKLAAVAASTAADLEELSTGMSKVASAANLMGVDVDQLNAQLATIVSVTRQAPESVGVALKTIYARMSDIKSGLDDETTLGNYTEKMAQYGINVLDANNNLRDMGDVIEEIGGKWTSMSREQQVALAQTIAGTRQYNNLLSLFDNWGMYTDALETSANAAGTLQKQQDIYMESTAAHLQQLSTEAERTYDILFDQKTVNGFTDALTGLLGVFNDLLAGLGGGIKDFAFFGSTVANIFNKQIGSAIERQIENFEKMRANVSREELQKSIIAQGGVAGEGVTNAAAVDKEAAYAEKTLELQKYLTAEQAEQFTNETAEIGLLEQRIQGIEQYKKIAEQLGVQISEDAAETQENFEEQIDAQSKLFTIENKRYKSLKKGIEDYVEGTEHAFDSTEAQKEIVDDLILNLGDMKTAKEDEARVASIIEKVNNNEKLDEQEIQFILENQKNVRNDISNKVNELKIGAQGVADEESGILIDLQNEQILREKNLQAMQAQVERQKQISQLVQGVTALTSLLVSLSGIVETLNDDSLSAGEKVERVIAVLMSNLPILLTNLNALKGLLPTIASLTNKAAIAMGAEGVTAASGFGSSLMGIISIVGPYVLAIGAVIGVAYALVKAYNADADAAQEATENAKKAKEEYEGIKQSYQELTENISKYGDSLNAIKKLEKGTQAWKEQVLELNEQVLKLLETYPQLAKYVTNTNGVLGFTQEGINELLNQQWQVVQGAYRSNIAAQLNANQKQFKSDTTDFRRGISYTQKINPQFQQINSNNQRNFSTSSEETTSRIMTEDEANKLIDALRQHGLSILENDKTLIDATGFNKELAAALLKNRDAIINFNTKLTNLDASDIVMKSQSAQSYLTVHGGDAFNKLSAEDQARVSTAVAKSITEESINNYRKGDYDEGAFGWSWLGGGKSDADIQKEYAKLMGYNTDKIDNKTGKAIYRDANDKEIEVSDKIAREALAQEAALRDAAAGTEEYVNAINAMTEAGNNAAKNLNLVGTEFDNTAKLLKTGFQSKFDFSTATDDQLKGLGLLRNNEEEWAKVQAGWKAAGYSSAEEFTKAFDEQYNYWNSPEKSAERAKNLAAVTEQQFNAALRSDAEALKTTESALQSYTEHLMKTNKALADDKLLAEKIAVASFQFADGVEALGDALDSNYDLLQDWRKGLTSSVDAYKAIGKVQDALEEMFNIRVSEDFINEHFEQLRDLANGNVEALEELQDAAAKDYVAHLYINADDTRIQEIRNELNGYIDEFSQKNIEVGASIDDTDFINALNNMIDQGELTSSQVQDYLNSMGYEPEFEEQSAETPPQAIEASTALTFDPGGEDGLVGDIQVGTLKTSTTVDGVTATMFGIKSADGGDRRHVKGVKRTSNTAGRKNAVKNSGGSGKKVGNGGSSGGGGGKSSEPKEIKEIEDEADRYHEVNTQISKVDKSLQSLQSQQKKLFGSDLLNNLNKQWQELNAQVTNYNEKLRIAEEEQDELRKQLTKQGVAFNADGTIANYESAYKMQQEYVNNLIRQYNALSAEQQQVWDDNETIDKAKENFEEFKKNLDRYDEIVSSFAPELRQSIQDAIDKQIDLQIEKFNMEIKLRLDLAEAERDWNEFKKKIIDGIEDDDILGNAMAKLVDFSSYYKEDNTGIVQALRKQVDNTLAELNQMDTNGWSNVYGDNRTAALDDLKKYYEELMSNLTDVLELQKEIHESYIDMMDEAQEKFDEQIQSYEMISDLIDHDMQVISLVYGEESYSKLAKYYDKQQENFNNQLDFQKQQVDFWRQQLDTLDEGSDSWENAKEKWANAVEEMNGLIENSIENLQDKYLNAINLIFQNLNDKVTNGLGLDYVEEEWNLINKNADQYLDTVNSLYEVQKLENKYLDALDNTDSISAQRQLKEIMDEELANLRERDKLTEYDIERANKKYEIALKQIALQEAQQNKTKMRLRRDSQGNYRYEYVADGDQIGQLQDELNDMYNSLYNFDKSKYQENLSEMYSIWVEFQEKMAEAAQISDPVKRSERELLLQTQYEQLINSLTNQNATIRENLEESVFNDLAELYDIDISNFQEMTDEEKDILMGELLPYWDSGLQHMTDAFAGEDGFLGVCKDAFDQLHEATKDYEDGLSELETTGELSFESIGEGIDENIDRTQQLISNNTELINSYEQELTAIGNIIAQLDDLVNKYNAAKDAAIAATKAAYEYWSEQQRQAATAAGNANGGSGSGNGNSGSGSGSSGSGAGRGSALGGDNNLVIGETATYSGRYYYDSYGSSPTGSKYSGVANGIVVDRITNNPYGIHIHSADGRYRDLGWVKKSQLSGYDTGGYTGEWGSDGRLALLHQKELVLNKEDTANMLNAISIMRNITNMLGSSVLGKLAAATAGGLSTDVNGDVLEQNVHIDAQFPNVKDSREIEEALNNLVNMASMRANRR